MSKLWLLHLIPNAPIEYELLDNQITLFPTVDSDFVYVNPFSSDYTVCIFDASNNLFKSYADLSFTLALDMNDFSKNNINQNISFQNLIRN